MINSVHSNSRAGDAPRTPTFREKDAICIEVAATSTQRPPRHESRHAAADRLAQMNYFAQSIGQAMPAARPSAANMARYTAQRPLFSLSV